MRKASPSPDCARTTAAPSFSSIRTVAILRLAFRLEQLGTVGKKASLVRSCSFEVRRTAFRIGNSSLMVHRLHLFPSLTLLLVSLAIQLHLSWWMLRSPAWKSALRRAILVLGNLGLAAFLTFSYLLSFYRVFRQVPIDLATWGEAFGLIAAAGLVGLYAGAILWRQGSSFRPERRIFFQAAGAAVMAAPYIATGIGMATRNQFHINTVDVPIPNLPKDLQGLRIAQVTDIHLSVFLSEKEFARAVDMANETKPHLTLVTGDLITRFGDPLDECLRQLKRLRADAGVLGCMGNHEIYC